MAKSKRIDQSFCGSDTGVCCCYSLLLHQHYKKTSTENTTHNKKCVGVAVKKKTQNTTKRVYVLQSLCTYEDCSHIDREHNKKCVGGSDSGVCCRYSLLLHQH